MYEVMRDLAIACILPLGQGGAPASCMHSSALAGRSSGIKRPAFRIGHIATDFHALFITASYAERPPGSCVS